MSVGHVESDGNACQRSFANRSSRRQPEEKFHVARRTRSTETFQRLTSQESIVSRHRDVRGPPGQTVYHLQKPFSKVPIGSIRFRPLTLHNAHVQFELGRLVG